MAAWPARQSLAVAAPAQAGPAPRLGGACLGVRADWQAEDTAAWGPTRSWPSRGYALAWTASLLLWRARHHAEGSGKPCRRHGSARLAAGRPGRRPPRLRRGRLKATAVLQGAACEEREARKVNEFEHREQRCWLVEWPLPEHLAVVDAWLDKWKYSARGHDSNVEFWRRRTVMAMQQKLELAGRPDFSGRRGETEQVSKPVDFRVFALHLEGELSSAPLAMAFVLERPFPMGVLEALHLDQLVARPGVSGELSGVGAALVRALSRCAAEDGRIVTVEPQSQALESYFGQLSFRHAPIVDPYLWFLAGAAGGPGGEPTVEVRFALLAREDHERVLAAFKRPPLWLAKSEEVFITLRQDTSACDILAVRMSSMEAVARAEASSQHFQRAGAGSSYRAGASEPVDLVEAMTVTRNPDVLDHLEWGAAACMRQPGASGPRYMVAGRCTVAQRAYPLPGVGPGLEMVVDALELPTCAEPVFSVAVHAPLAAVGDITAAVKDLLDRFRARAALRRNAEAWNLELVQSDGLVAAELEQTPLPEELDAEPLF